MSDVDVNKIQQNVKELQDQNAIDFQQWKKLGKDIEKLSEKIKLSDTNLIILMKKIKNDYENLKKIIIDENIQVQLNNKIEKNKNEINKKVNIETFENKVDEISSQLDTINNKKANKIELEVERQRINNLTTLQQGSTTGDAELIDGRIGADGISYENLGKAIRTQFTNSNNKIENIIGEKIEYIYEYVDGGYIDNTNGNLVSFSGWKYTDFIVIGKNIKELFCETSLDGSYSYNAFYDVNKKFIKSFSVNNGKITIPEEAYSFRLSVKQGSNTSILKVFDSLINKCNADDVMKLSQKSSKILIDKYLGVETDYNINWNNDGYISNVNGQLIENDNWKYTDFIEINEGIKQLEIETNMTGSYSYNGFYDSEKNYIGILNTSNKVIDKPQKAKYFRLSVSKNFNITVKNRIEKLVDKCTLKEVKELIDNTDVTDIITLNKDVEPFVIQASEGLGRMFSNKTTPLVFVHLSDVHTKQELWDRTLKYINNYSNYIKFGIHTGDYCGGSQLSYIDLYTNGISCSKPIFNCVGNHDTFSDNQGTRGTKQKTKELLFNHTENWEVVFMDIENSMTYYKDFANEKIRFIVMDYYYDIDAQCTWLLERLNGAKALGYHVVTCMHEMTNVITNKLDTTFQTLDNFEALGGNKYSVSKFDKVIGDWKKAGGIHVANFAGHEHSDFIGYTENDVLNVCVQSATDDIVWTDGKRVQGTRTWDCFNVVSVEVSTGTLKLIRIGNNSDHYLREKKVISYDYINKKIIYN